MIRPPRLDAWRQNRKLAACGGPGQRVRAVLVIELKAFVRSVMSDIKKVVLAYSGGLDTSVILKWLQDVYQCEIVTFTADLGQGEELEPARQKALMAGIKLGCLAPPTYHAAIQPALSITSVCWGLSKCHSCLSPILRSEPVGPLNNF